METFIVSQATRNIFLGSFFNMGRLTHYILLFYFTPYIQIFTRISSLYCAGLQDDLAQKNI